MTNIRIHAVIVTYQPNLEQLAKSLSQLQPQVNEICIVDNCSSNHGQIQALAFRYPSCTLLPLSTNRGVGAAQNIGIQQAIVQGANQVLVLDQDSVMSCNAVDTLSRSLLQLETSNKAAAVGPQYRLDGQTVASPFVRYHWFYLGRVPAHELRAKPFVETDFLISSGTLFSATALRQVGLMNANLFIDHVDTEWCLRARAKRYSLFGIRDAYMEHSLGERTHRIWLGRWRLLPRHKPFRYYFTYRNSLLLARMPYVPLKWFTADCIRLVSMAIFCLIAPGERMASIKMAWRGIKDGLHGRCPQVDIAEP